MDRRAIKLAVKLLAKAESTDSEPESVALALRGYSLLERSIPAHGAKASEPASEPGQAERSGPRRRAAHSEASRAGSSRATVPGRRSPSSDAVALAYSRFDGSRPSAPGVGVAL